MSWSNYITRRLIDYMNPGWPAFRFRKKRANRLKALISDIYAKHGKVNIIDVGGIWEYWRIIPDNFLDNHNVRITIINPHPLNVPGNGIFKFIRGDGRDLSRFTDQAFHLAHSNSVIEHVGDWDDMQRFAGEIRRVALHYFVQTPNFWFPVEPHLVFPFFQFLPVNLRIWLIMHFSLGWWKKTADAAFARKRVESIRLLTRREFQQLFPESTVYTERFALMVKSFIAVR
jgi:hypothetical protein